MFSEQAVVSPTSPSQQSELQQPSSLAENIMPGHFDSDSSLPSDMLPLLNASTTTEGGDSLTTAQTIRKWDSMLTYLISESQDDDWLPVIRRIITHPNEITIVGENAGMTALHAACIRYPPVHIVQAIVTTRPASALHQNFSGETPLHLASYSASEEVQECLLAAAPAAAAMRDQYGDSPLHFAARAGATLPLLRKMVHAYPQAISSPNERGVTPFWLLPRAYLEAETLEEILNDDGEDDDYRRDWDSLVLFLRYSYYGKERAADMIARGLGSGNFRQEFSWMVHAAAATPSCPRQVLAFLCRLFPEQALAMDEQGYTPLQLAVRAPVTTEPTKWNESEDGIRELYTATDSSSSSSSKQGKVLREQQQQQQQEGQQDQPLREEETEKEEVISVLDILLEWSPASVNVRDSEGRLALTNALEAGQGWETVVSRLLQACPSCVSETDPVTGFTQAQVAALHSDDINSVFALVRAMPESLKESPSSYAVCGSKRSLLSSEHDLDHDQQQQQQPDTKKCRRC